MMFPIQFDRPGWLILLVLLVPVITLAWHGVSRRGARGRAVASTITRCLIIILLSVAIARPVWEQTGEGVSVIAVLDRSQSIPKQIQNQAVETLKEWTSPDRRGEHNRLAVISVGREVSIGSMPNKLTVFEPAANEPDGTATNISKGVQMAIALLPRDTASRILVVSDGNETDGQVLSVANQANASGIPIDVLPLLYDHTHEVMIEKVVAPSQARFGQSVPVRIILRSIAQSSGVLHVLQNGVELDVSPKHDGNGIPMSLHSGVNAVMFDIPIQTVGSQKFEAMWVPDAGTDSVTSNNTGIAVTFVSNGGIILLVTQNELNSQHLRDILTSAGLTVEVSSPKQIPRDSIGFSEFDAVILVDIARWMIDDLQEKQLYSFVHDLGGGLLLTGGPNAFGAGGWIGSQLEQAMPIQCEPPQTRELPRGALALIMHSCEMPEGNYWGQRMAKAAVDSLSELDYVGIIEYNWNGGDGTINNSGWTLPLQLAGDKKAAIDAINRLVFGDMQDFGSPMQVALNGLVNVDAAQRHVIIISDGDPIGPSQELLSEYRAAEVTVSTVMVGGHGSPTDRQKMKGIATVTGGRFYMVNNPNKLPSIFIKEAQLNSRSLLQEGGDWDVVLRPSVTGPVQGIYSVPLVNGYVVAGTKGGFAQTPWFIQVSDGDDPLLAWWHYGLGKSIALMTDLGNRWATQWPSWAEFPEFLEGCIRWVMRGSSPPNMSVTSRVEGDRGIVDLEAVDAENQMMNFMQSKAVVINPKGDAIPLTLQQTGPGRYHAEFNAKESGAWLVNIAFQDKDGSVTGRIPTAVTVPYPKEYSTTSHNASLLHQLAERTGGRVLSLDDVESIDLFDETTIQQPVSPHSMWDLLAVIAACMLVLDVAIRRLWIDKKSMQTLLAPVEKVSTGSVEALRKVHKPKSEGRRPIIEHDDASTKPAQPTPPKKPKQELEGRDDNLSQLLKKKRERNHPEDDK
ncbi:MAG: VWA domain-containing protein [Phycisphaerales bacterium]|nr:VWA domain-containing protein [Planctomycetota bacterium]MBL6997428.1 VWA domain-containing protein [Phycisphaerales bacterium]